MKSLPWRACTQSAGRVSVTATAASSKPAEFAVHAKGALANGCTRAQVQDVLLLVAMYCGIPAAIEPNRIAAEIFGKDPPSADVVKPEKSL